MNIAMPTAVYASQTGTPPALTVQNDLDFYWLPQGTSVQPPGIGTTCQYVLQPLNPQIGSNASVSAQLPRLGGYITVVAYIMRDALQQRIDGWPARPRFSTDGIPLIDSDLSSVLDDMAVSQSIGSTVGGALTSAATPQGVNGAVINQRPVGVITETRKTALMQRMLGLLESGEVFLSTNPGTAKEISGAPWGSITNPPAQLTVLAGQVVPSGQLIQGLPEV